MEIEETLEFGTLRNTLRSLGEDRVYEGDRCTIRINQEYVW